MTKKKKVTPEEDSIQSDDQVVGDAGVEWMAGVCDHLVLMLTSTVVAVFTLGVSLACWGYHCLVPDDESGEPPSDP